MFGCFNCTVLRNENIKKEIHEDIEKRVEELQAKARELGMTATVILNQGSSEVIK